jgi:hypothetical protein
METIGCFEKCQSCRKYYWQDENPTHWDFTIMGKFSFQRIYLKLKKFTKFSSSKQRGYFHAVIVTAYAEASGLDHNSAYESLMLHFYPIEFVDPITKKIVITRISYMELSTVEAENLHSHARSLMLEMFGLILPLPNEPWGQYG